MRTRRKFCPSESWILEDRVALDGATVAADIVSAAAVARSMRMTFEGRFLTTPPPGIGGGETTSLAGTGRSPRAGIVRVAGGLRSNASVAPPFSGTTGAVIVTSARLPGSATVSLSGPPADLSPTRRSLIPLTFRVTNTTGRFSPFAGVSGTGTLVLRSRLTGAPGGVIVGRFTLRLVDA